MQHISNLKEFLDTKVDEYNQPFFIKEDPISVPHFFSKKQDIEISALFAALFAWGNRVTIINKATELMNMMDRSPHDFVIHAGDLELKALINFRHRTFNATDLFYFIEFLRAHYSKNDSLESAFRCQPFDENTEQALNYFHSYFFSLEDAPPRTRKHIATPAKGSTCKRLNMFLRWMVRSDKRGVDFGLWKAISPAQLICPIDVHVARVAKRFKLLHRKQTDWLAAVELTRCLKTLDAADPVKYDFALFGLGAIEKF
jgi:uncharacterized protein (TIGR02757 family)